MATSKSVKLTKNLSARSRNRFLPIILIFEVNMEIQVLLVNFFTYGILIGVGCELDTKIIYKVLLCFVITLIFLGILFFRYFI